MNVAYLIMIITVFIACMLPTTAILLSGDINCCTSDSETTVTSLFLFAVIIFSGITIMLISMNQYRMNITMILKLFK